MANNENIHENTPCWGINTGLSWQKRKWMPFLQQISIFLVPGSFPLIFECNSITLKHYHLISSSLARVSFHFCLRFAHFPSVSWSSLILCSSSRNVMGNHLRGNQEALQHQQQERKPVLSTDVSGTRWPSCALSELSRVCWFFLCWGERGS